MSILFGDDDGPAGDRPMTLFEHLEELRKRLFWCVAVAVACMILCACYEERLLGIALWPAQSVLKTMPNASFISTETGEKFFTGMKLDVVAGVFLAGPIILYILWGFVARGLHAHEKRYVRIYAPISYFLFLGGCVFFYFWLQPMTLGMLLPYHEGDIITPFGETIHVEMKLSFKEIVNFFLSMALVTGLIFELPLVMLFLQAIRICTWRTYLKYAAHFSFGLLVFSAIITPTGDALTLIVFMIPVLALFFGGVLMCRMMGPKDI
jgi:sec-independent protein translocase protein TatC